MSGLVFGPLQKKLQGEPDPLPQVPKEREKPPLAATPKDPGNVPGENDKATGAGAADEKRRILRMMPKKTENKFAGDNTAAAPVEKKRLLGGGTTGRITTGE